LTRIPTVDALRGLAASIVVFHHAFVIFPGSFRTLREVSPRLFHAAQLISNSNVEAVLLFFVISGFSIRLSANRLDLTRKADINTYLFKRFKRLLPLYWSALVLTLCVGFLTSRLDAEAFSLTNLAGNLAFLQAPASVRGVWFVPYGDNYPLWSLSFEMFFYLLFPFVVLAGKTLAARRFSYISNALFLLVIAGSALALALYNLFPNPLALFASHFVIWYLGVELAEVQLGHKQAKDGFVLFGSVLIVLWLIVRWTGSASLSNILIGFSIFMIWRVVQILQPHRHAAVAKADRLFCGVFGGLGLISYSVYLFHYPIMRFMAAQEDLASIVSLAIAVFAALFVAYVGENLAKRPAYGFLRLRYVR